MRKEKKIACVIGTRPEVIKMAPIIAVLKKLTTIKLCIIITAQHRHLLDDMLTVFDIHPSFDMNIMQENQTLATLTGKLFIEMDRLFNSHHFDGVMAQGDTTTTLVTAQTAFYYRIPFAHVEAGLRSYNLWQPFPEELNRVFVSKLATWHFAPTEQEKNNLLCEQTPANSILVTGNTVIDALYMMLKKTNGARLAIPAHKRLILLTLHRRESFGEPIKEIFQAINTLTALFDDIYFIYPVHPSPHVKSVAYAMLADNRNVQLLAPQHYDVFVHLMAQAYLIMTDSGGIQEEAPALNKPLIILRDITERPLIVDLGLGILAGTSQEKIIAACSLLLRDQHAYQAMQKNISPYGDGKAAERIADFVVKAIEEGKL